MCRSRRELSNEYLLAKIGVDTAENELLQVLFNIIQSSPFSQSSFQTDPNSLFFIRVLSDDAEDVLKAAAAGPRGGAICEL